MRVLIFFKKKKIKLHMTFHVTAVSRVIISVVEYFYDVFSVISVSPKKQVKLKMAEIEINILFTH